MNKLPIVNTDTSYFFAFIQLYVIIKIKPGKNKFIKSGTILINSCKLFIKLTSYSLS